MLFYRYIAERHCEPEALVCAEFASNSSIGQRDKYLPSCSFKMAPVTTASEATESISPNQTYVFSICGLYQSNSDLCPSLYVTNLSDKLQKHDLRRALYMLFSTYGPVIDVIALKTMKMRGQAHIVFRDVQTSTQAMRALQAFNFFGKEMVGQLHKTRTMSE